MAAAAAAVAVVTTLTMGALVRTHTAISAMPSVAGQARSRAAAAEGGAAVRARLSHCGTIREDPRPCKAVGRQRSRSSSGVIRGARAVSRRRSSSREVLASGGELSSAVRPRCPRRTFSDLCGCVWYLRTDAAAGGQMRLRGWWAGKGLLARTRWHRSATAWGDENETRRDKAVGSGRAREAHGPGACLV